MGQLFWNKKDEKRIEAQSWFSYAVMLPNLDEDEREVIIIGNYMIKNTGNETVNNPIICIGINPTRDVRLGGKIGSAKHSAMSIDGTNTGAWEYIHTDWKKKSLETGEHWLKPKFQPLLTPGETITFAHELSFSLLQKEKLVNVDGFAYFDEIKNGITSINKITINF